MFNLEEMTVETLKDIKEAWLQAWCAAVQSHSIRDSDFAAILADASVDDHYTKNRHYN